MGAEAGRFAVTVLGAMMTPDDVPKIATGVGGIVTAILGYLTWRENQRKGERETTEQRTDHEMKERKDDLDRNDAGVRYLMDQFREEIVRLKADVDVLRQRLERSETRELETRADLTLANVTIRTLTKENERLAARVAELEEKQGGR